MVLIDEIVQLTIKHDQKPFCSLINVFTDPSIKHAYSGVK